MKKLIYKVELVPCHLGYNELCQTLADEIFNKTFDLKGRKVVVKVYSAAL